MNEELRWQIETFFNYWRQRHAFIRDLDFAEHNHEANVLLWAHLDALSNLWAKNIGKEQYGKKKGIIFDAFLARYGGETFQIISLPHLWDRANRGHDIWGNQKKQLKLPKDVYTFLSTIGGRQTPTFFNERQLRHSLDDWSMDAIVTATLTNYPGTDRTELEEWLTLSRYGAIAYKEMRCTYIHEGQPGRGTHGFELSDSAIKPTYLSGIYTTPPIIGFKAKFMLDVLEDSINAFEADALALQTDPVPEQ
jgi:hypothetical protein